MTALRIAAVAVALLALPDAALATVSIPAVTVTSGANGAQQYSVTLQILFIMTALTLLPSFAIMMTSFTRIIVVFAILRQAIGLQQTPSNQILVGLALFLTFFVMAPVFKEANERALQPYLAEQIAPEEALERAAVPFKRFMLAQARKDDLALFENIAGAQPAPARSSAPAEVPAEVPAEMKADDVGFFVLVPAFMTSELKTAFQMGFILFIPFLVIDMVVASVLMSMGMMMLSPLIISLPFKIMLFVMVDGWVLVMGTLASSFGAPT